MIDFSKGRQTRSTEKANVIEQVEEAKPVRSTRTKTRAAIQATETAEVEKESSQDSG